MDKMQYEHIDDWNNRLDNHSLILDRHIRGRVNRAPRYHLNDRDHLMIDDSEGNLHLVLLIHCILGKDRLSLSPNFHVRA